MLQQTLIRLPMKSLTSLEIDSDYEFEVKQSDIENGECETAANCAVAQAFRRMFPLYHICVDHDDILLWIPGKHTIAFDVNPVIRQFIIDFDSGKEVMPTKFTTTVLRNYNH